MKKIISFVIALLALFFKSPQDARSLKKTENQTHLKNKQEKQVKEGKILLSRVEIAKKLQELKNKPLPQNLSLGAECYEVAMKPNRIEYVCPVCGQKTLYNASLFSHPVETIHLIRSFIKALEPYQITLDERFLCQFCKQQANENSLCLNIPFSEDGQKIYRKCKIQKDEIQLLYEFLTGKVTHSNEYGQETPLVHYLQNLEKILGISISANPR